MTCRKKQHIMFAVGAFFPVTMIAVARVIIGLSSDPDVQRAKSGFIGKTCLEEEQCDSPGGVARRFLSIWGVGSWEEKQESTKAKRSIGVHCSNAI